MPTPIAITVTASLNINNEPVFTYDPSGPVVVTQKSRIDYTLVDNTGKNLGFAGAAFTTPFDSIVDSVEVTPNLLSLFDTDKVVGETGFHLVFTIPGSTLLMCSPDPQIINKI